MKKGVLFVVVTCCLMMLWTTGCTDKKPAADSVSVAAITDTSAIDTSAQTLMEEQPVPKAADELFDDFIFNFASNRKLQRKRIAFPLKVIKGHQITYLQKSQWKTEHFFMRQGYYTLIFDNTKQMNVVKDTSINHVTIEKIYLKRKRVKQYNFDRINGQWMLTSIATDAAYHKSNASFLDFYQHFTSDSTYQMKSLHNPIIFSGPDPDDDFSTMTGEIAPETWPAFAPKLPKNFIYNIMYGQSYVEGKRKIFVMRGIANGMEMQLVFKRFGKAWKLIKLSE